jgi:RNA polymerase sigma factor (sigma-70 family)
MEEDILEIYKGLYEATDRLYQADAPPSCMAVYSNTGQAENLSLDSMLGQETGNESKQKRKYNGKGYTLNKIFDKERLSPEEQISISKKISCLRKNIFTEAIKHKPIYSKVIDEIYETIQKEQQGIAMLHELSDIVYLEGKELKRFKGEFMKKKASHRNAYLARLLEKTDFRSDYYEKIISWSQQNAPFIYKGKPGLSRALSELESYKKEMVERNMRLVPYVIKKFFSIPTHLAFDDLVDEGAIGLIKAVDKFEYKMDYQFATMAVWWIKQAISRAIIGLDATIRIPVHQHTKLAHLDKAYEKLSIKLRRNPTDCEIAEYMKLSAEEVKKLREVIQPQTVSLSHPIGLEQGNELIDTIKEEEPGRTESTALNRIMYDQAMDIIKKRLNERELYVLEQRVAHDKTLGEIGQKVNLTRERIRQIEAMAKRKARKAIEKSGLKVNWGYGNEKS